MPNIDKKCSGAYLNSREKIEFLSEEVSKYAEGKEEEPEWWNAGMGKDHEKLRGRVSAKFPRRLVYDEEDDGKGDVSNEELSEDEAEAEKEN